MTWLDLLRTEVQSTTMTKAAERLGISRTAVSLCLSGKYGAKTDKVAAKVLDVLGAMECPALAETITPLECEAYRTRSAPLNNPMAMRHWRACQHCPHNPNAMEADHVRIH